MKKILLSTLLLIIGLTTYAAVWQSQGEAEITFEKTTHNFGSFPESSPKVTCVFKFKNSGDGPLVIHQAIASCGCTVPQYPKEPIKPGESGQITIKNIQIRDIVHSIIFLNMGIIILKYRYERSLKKYTQNLTIM